MLIPRNFAQFRATEFRLETLNLAQSTIDHLWTCLRLLTPHFPLNAKRFNFTYYILFNLSTDLFHVSFFSTPRGKHKIDVTQFKRFKVHHMVQQNYLKGVFAKNERGYRLNAIKKRFWSLLILLLSVASIRRKLLKTSHTE